MTITRVELWRTEIRIRTGPLAVVSEPLAQTDVEPRQAGALTRRVATERKAV